MNNVQTFKKSLKKKKYKKNQNKNVLFDVTNEKNKYIILIKNKDVKNKHWTIIIVIYHGLLNCSRGHHTGTADWYSGSGCGLNCVWGRATNRLIDSALSLRLIESRTVSQQISPQIT